MKNIQKGSCLCGKVQFKYSGPLSDFSICHCTMCQKFSGTAFGTFIGLKKDHFVYTSGEDYVTLYDSSSWSSRAFCKHCGSSLMYIYHKMPDTLSVSAGLFDNPLPVKPSKHIFVKNKCNWLELKDDLPKLSTF